MDQAARNDILKQFAPKAVLKALTGEAAQAVPTGLIVEGMVPILRFPFRVGRESRVSVVKGQLYRIERPRGGAQAPNNDLYLVDGGDPMQISREHFVIERRAEGFFVVDRGSACGTGVGKAHIQGGNLGGAAPLRDGETIVVGTGPTPYRYQFISLE